MTVDRTPAHLADMLRFVQELRGLLADQPLEMFLANRVLCLATEKLFINLGEAASRIDAARCGQMLHVPWRQVIGLRNILAHGYEQVEHETLFNTVARDLPQLEETLSQELLRYQLR
jgi:uncharacterized protein with HEPN domain